MDTVNWVSKVLSSSHEEREGDQKDDSCLVMQSKDIVVDAHLVYFDEVAKGAEDVHDVMMVLRLCLVSSTKRTAFTSGGRKGEKLGTRI